MGLDEIYSRVACRALLTQLPDAQPQTAWEAVVHKSKSGRVRKVQPNYDRRPTLAERRRAILKARNGGGIHLPCPENRLVVPDSPASTITNCRHQPSPSCLRARPATHEAIAVW